MRSNVRGIKLWFLYFESVQQIILKMFPPTSKEEMRKDTIQALLLVEAQVTLAIPAEVTQNDGANTFHPVFSSIQQIFA